MHSKLRVLVVDDQPDVVEMLSLFVEKEGHATQSAETGRQALAVAAEFEPDVVLLDVGLPDINGYDVARALRDRPNGEKMFLVAVTGWGRNEDRVRAVDAGFDRHITKPASSYAIRLALIDAALRHMGR